jgi:hypothetical protein
MSASVMVWLRDFAACVRARDFDRGRTLCSQSIVSFGTVAHIAVGLEQLVHQQWTHVLILITSICKSTCGKIWHGLLHPGHHTDLRRMGAVI